MYSSQGGIKIVKLQEVTKIINKRMQETLTPPAKFSLSFADHQLFFL